MSLLTVVLDSNALIYSISKRVDIEKWLSMTVPWNRIVVPSSVRDELVSLSQRNRFAGGALKLVERYAILQVSSTGDEGVIEAALGSGGMVLTNDRNLIKRLRALGIRTLSISKNKRVVLTQ
ncbi:MAG TPA: twitching motility protein PilT [Thermoplasmataceae archaeon]|nr:twitching motility protein PilT [Thermoplasmatales archaeon AK]HLH86083.1 twitching motility protein PilT [Thermoplasmataceae archaeon]